MDFSWQACFNDSINYIERMERGNWMKKSWRRKTGIWMVITMVLTTLPTISPQVEEKKPVVTKAATKTSEEDIIIKDIMLGTDMISAPKSADSVYGWQGDWISFGKKKWRVLDPATTAFNSAEETTAGKEKILLHRDTMIEESTMDAYEESTALENDLTAGEIKAVSASVKAGDNPLMGEKFFFLDETEATNANYGYGNAKSRISNILENGETWWLRSKTADSRRMVETDGTIITEKETESNGIRPAMTLDTSRVLLASPTLRGISYDKSESVRLVPNYFGVVSGIKWQLTLQGVDVEGNEVSSLDAKVKSGTLAPGNTVTFTHKAANILAGASQVSVMICTEEDGIRYYGKINEDVTATTSELTLPTEMKPGNYQLYVFGEDVNYGGNTDFATAVSKEEAMEMVVESEYEMGSGDTLFMEKVGTDTYRNIIKDEKQIIEVDNKNVIPRVINGTKKLTVPCTFSDSGSENPATQVSYLITEKSDGNSDEKILDYGQAWYKVPDADAALTFVLPEWYENETIYLFLEKVTTGTTTGYASEMVQLDFANVEWTENGNRDRTVSVIVEEEADSTDDCSVTLLDGADNDTIFSVEDFVVSTTSSNNTSIAEGLQVTAINGETQVQGAGEACLTISVDSEFAAQETVKYLWWKEKLLGEIKVIKRVVQTRNLEKTYAPKFAGTQLTTEELQEMPILQETESNAAILFYTDEACTTLVGSQGDTVSGINYYGAMPPGAGKVGDEPIDAGTYYFRIEMFPSEKNEGYVTATKTFTVHKDSVTIKAADQTIELGSNVSQVPSEGIENYYFGTSHCYYVNSVVLTADSLEMNVENNKITPSDAVIYCKKHWETVGVDITKNFNISYEPGNLTVTEKVVATPTPTPSPDVVYTDTDISYHLPDSYENDDSSAFENKETTVKKLGRPIIKKVKRNKTGKKIILQIKKKVKGAKGYQVAYATNKKFKKKKTKSGKGLKISIFGIKKKKVYFVKVRAYKVDDSGKKRYGKWSKVKKAK